MRTCVLFIWCWLLAAAAVGQDTRYSPRTDWDAYSNTSVNISVYVFRDMNRDGTYDMGDRPMSGIFVDAKSSTKSVTERSNISGFANFEMSATDPAKAITAVGMYEFTVVPPPGFTVTTGNAVQGSAFELFPGAPADIIAATPPRPVGLAPDLYIEGSAPAGVETVEMMGPDGSATTAKVSPDGGYLFAAVPGEWRVSAKGMTERLVTVRGHPILLSQLRVAEANPSTAADITIGFDDLRLGSVFKVPSGYGGLAWDNFVMAHEKIYPILGYRNITMSGEFAAYNGSGHPAAISSDTPFTFVGTYVGASNDEAEGEVLHVTAWRGSALAYEQAVSLSAYGPIYLDARFENITRLEFRTEHYWQVIFDDMTFQVSP